MAWLGGLATAGRYMGLVLCSNGDWQGKTEGTTMETYFNAIGPRQI